MNDENDINSSISLHKATDSAVSEKAAEKYLTFYTDKQLFGISIKKVVQIVGMQEISAVPDFPSYAKGIINLRGAIIPIIDVRLRLHKPEAEYNEKTCIVIINVDENYLGLIVDTVDEVAEITVENISPPPYVSSDYTNAFLTGIAKLNGKIILLVDTDRMLNRNELQQIME